MLSCIILYRPLYKDLGEKSSGEILTKKSLHEDLAETMSYMCLYESSCGRLLGRSCFKILQDPLLRPQVLFVRSCELLGVLT